MWLSEQPAPANNSFSKACYITEGECTVHHVLVSPGPADYKKYQSHLRWKWESNWRPLVL